MTERYDFDATAPCGYRERPDGDFVAYGRYRDLAARLAEAEALLQEVYDGRHSPMSIGLVYRIGHTLNHRTPDSASD